VALIGKGRLEFLLWIKKIETKLISFSSFFVQLSKSRRCNWYYRFSCHVWIGYPDVLRFVKFKNYYLYDCMWILIKTKKLYSYDVIYLLLWNYILLSVATHGHESSSCRIYFFVLYCARPTRLSTFQVSTCSRRKTTSLFERWA
jgi:hypothetical protein